ncbi:MAG TPA: alpha/beta hydrolase [Ilumatobacteraceae bacterium]|jgi:acetyl esterase
MHEPASSTDVPVAPLSPAADVLLAGIGAVMGSVERQSVAALRARASLAPSAPSADSAIRVTDHTEHNVRVHRPAQSAGVLVAFHGGGFVLGGLGAADRLCTRLARSLGWTVVAVDYPLSPEHPLPAAIETGLEAVRWAAGQCAALADVSRLGIVGDSAGGGIAAAVCHALRGDASVAIEFQLLLQPVVRCRIDPHGYPSDRDTALLTAEAMAFYSRQYLAGGCAADDPRASPVLATDLAGLPPTIVATSGHDPLAPDAAKYVHRLLAADVFTLHLHEPTGFHGWFSFVDVLDDAATGWARVVEQTTSMANHALGWEPPVR